MGKILGLTKKSDARQIGRFFKEMCLPLPNKGGDFDTRDFHMGTGGGRVVFLTRYGCVVSITPDKRRSRISHPHLLKPLFNRRTENYQIEINPGIICPISKDAVESIVRTIATHGLSRRDAHCWNFGLIKTATEDPFPIMIDPDIFYLETLEDEIEDKDEIPSLKKSLSCFGRQPKLEPSQVETAANDNTSPQGTIFGNLSRLFERAWPDNAKRPDPLKLVKAWEACAYMKAEGILAAPWESDPGGDIYMKNMHNYAKRYEEKFQA